MSKCCCVIKCFPVPGHTILSCGRFNLTYYKIFVLQIIITVGFHFFDIGSDIAILVDLYQTKSEYFLLSLMIILLPVIANFIMSLKTIPRSRCCICFLHLLKNTFIFGIFQGNLLASTFDIIKRGKKTKMFIHSRMIESLLESAPESLFQLFIILKNIETYTYYQVTVYYLSITFSILNLVMSLVSNETYLFNYTRRRIFYENPIRTIDYSIPFNISEKPIKSNSRYVILLTFYRLTEVLSRVGLLACIGNIYDGYLIIWFLLADLLLLILFRFCELVLDGSIFGICKLPHNENSFVNHIQVVFIVLLFKFFDRLKNLAVFSNYFLSLIKPGTMEVGLELDPVNIKTCILNIRYHFTSRYLNNTILSILIIYNLFVNTYSYSIFVISISSIISFVLNIFILSLILNYTLNYKSYQYIFKPIGCCKCVCCCKNKENEVEEKHPDDIVI